MKFKIHVKFEHIGNDSVRVTEKRFLAKSRVVFERSYPNLSSDQEALEKAKKFYYSTAGSYETGKEVLKRMWRFLRRTELNFVEDWGRPDEYYYKVKDHFIPPVKEWLIGFNKDVFFGRRPHSHIFFFHQSGICWKPKYGFPCFERNGERFIVLFNLFYVGYILHSPAILKRDFEDDYWEQILWATEFNACDIEKAKSTWPVKDRKGRSTWRTIYER